jgi:hypothetical protein
MVRPPDDTLAPVDVALGYRQLSEVKGAFRVLKHTLNLRLVYHRGEAIRAHVQLCWVAPLLVRIIERRTGVRLPQIRRSQRLHLEEFAGPEDAVWQRTETTTDLQRLLTALRIPEPPRIFAITHARAQAKGPADTRAISSAR